MQDGDDGYPMGVIIPVPASVFLPWLEDTPLNEQYKLLERVAKAKPENQRAVLESEKNSWAS